MGKYNLTEKKEKNAAYRSLVRAELVDELYEKILKVFVVDKNLLTDKRYADKNVEEISTMVGFANRQSFYAAFYKILGVTPRGYRMEHLAKEKETAKA